VLSSSNFIEDEYPSQISVHLIEHPIEKRSRLVEVDKLLERRRPIAHLGHLLVRLLAPAGERAP
jgi:hypothetical protein